MGVEVVKIISTEKLWKIREIILWNGLVASWKFSFKLGDRILWEYIFIFDLKKLILSILFWVFRFEYPEEIRWF